MPAKKTETNDTVELIGAEARKAIDAIAKGLGVAAKELWTIFVRQYLVKGVSELFTALVLFVAAYVLYPPLGWFVLIPVGFGILLVYGAINYLGNPKYYALNDITDKIKNFKKD